MHNFHSVYHQAYSQPGNNPYRGRVVIIAGPSCVGKTTLIQKLREGKLSDLQKQLNLHDLESWDFLDAWQIADFIWLGHRNLVLHYDILRLFDHNIPGYQMDTALHFLWYADQVEMLTLWEFPATLLDRCRRRQRKNYRNLKKCRVRLFFDRHHRLKQKIRLYQNSEVLLEWYDKWFDFCMSIPVTGHFVAHSQYPEEISQRKFASLQRGCRTEVRDDVLLSYMADIF
jgi:hypothetical protein